MTEDVDELRQSKSRGRGRGRARDQVMRSRGRARGGTSTRGGKGKGKQREEVVDDDTDDAIIQRTEDEPSPSEPTSSKPRPKPRQKKAAEKRPLSPQSPSKTRRKKPRNLSLVEMDTSDDTSLLTEAAAVMKVHDTMDQPTLPSKHGNTSKVVESAPSSQATQDVAIHDATDSQILTALAAPGGQNSPSTDDAIALAQLEAAIFTTPPAITRDDTERMQSSPLSSPPTTQEVSMEIDTAPSTSYALPHRVEAVPQRSASPIGHGGHMNRLKDGSGGSKPKPKRTYGRRK